MSTCHVGTKDQSVDYSLKGSIHHGRCKAWYLSVVYIELQLKQQQTYSSGLQRVIWTKTENRYRCFMTFEPHGNSSVRLLSEASRSRPNRREQSAHILLVIDLSRRGSFHGCGCRWLPIDNRYGQMDVPQESKTTNRDLMFTYKAIYNNSTQILISQ